MNKSAKILIVDDEPDILEFLGYNLRKENYQVFEASNGVDALKIAEVEKPDLILLDVMMPELGDIQTCQKLRNNSNLKEVRIIFLTAKNEEQSELLGFEAGADDYITKPVRLNIFLARVNALLNRKQSRYEQDLIISGDLSIDNEKRVVYKKGQILVLPRKEFKLLKTMMLKPGIVFTREELFSKI